MKTERQKRILELVGEHEIETQEELTARLREEGYTVTQATVSRDLKELKLSKATTAHGTYRYSLNMTKSAGEPVRLNHAMANSIVSIDFSLNNVVIKTYPGLAQAVASTVDGMRIADVLGCVAGDDTIILVTRSEESSAEISAQLQHMMKNM
jgi:transcriptional regulator of arginine metabolism